MSQLNALEKEMIVYKAPDEKHNTLLLPISPRRQRLHEEMKDYNGLGSRQLSGLPAPGWESRAEQDMKSIWCAKDKTKRLMTHGR